MPASDATEQQIEKVRQIVNVASFSDVANRIANLNGSAWAETVEDIAAWAPVKNKHTIIKGNGVDINKSRNRLDIQNRVRVRLGYPEVDENGREISASNCLPGSFGTFTVKKKATW